ncbi:hypothetical protein JOC75_004475 [Metabacillus crassostreae]|nr:hypothetical protein [Metabacillus crassostreae]
MFYQKRPKQIYFFASLLTKLQIISEEEKNSLLSKKQ